MKDNLIDICEYFEKDKGESIRLRNENIGPPDLCHVTKIQTAKGDQEVVDSSSSATLAAYMNSLTYSMEENPGWFGGNQGWKIKNVTYCCYNAFSRADIRVEIKIPGGVRAYFIKDPKTELPMNEELWIETYISSVVRAMLYISDLDYKVQPLRKMTIINSLLEETKFIDYTLKLFNKGWLLGSKPQVQFPTLCENYLVDSIILYCSITGRFSNFIDSLNKIRDQEPEVNYLLASLSLKCNKEIQSMKYFHAGMEHLSNNYSFLVSQSIFLLQKGKVDYALNLAQRAVNVSPSEFLPWFQLTQALLTLNSCPMFSYTPKEVPFLPLPAKRHIPGIPESILAYGIEQLSFYDTHEDSEQGILSRLPGNTLKGTFVDAYSLLTFITSKIGWDELLKFRSTAFVMEEEYRILKSKQNTMKKSNSITPSTYNDKSKDITTPVETVEITEKFENIDLDKSLSIDVSFDNIKENKTEETLSQNSPSANPVNNSKNKKNKKSKSKIKNSNSKDLKHDGVDTTNNVINNNLPAEDISSGLHTTNHTGKDTSSPEQIKKKGQEALNKSEEAKFNGHNTNDEIQNQIHNVTSLSPHSAETKVTDSTIEKIQTISPSKSKQVTQPSTQSDPPTNEKHISDNIDKRLCERWMDNLFMVLYEDLLAFTKYHSDISSIRSQRLAGKYSGSEWEYIGDLCVRLHRMDDARDAYSHSVHHRFSIKAWTFLLNYHTNKDNLPLAISAFMRVALCQSMPSTVLKSLRHLISVHGTSKINNVLISLNLLPEIERIAISYLDAAKNFHFIGSDL